MIKHYLTVFLISMVPIAELRAAIPYSQAVGLPLIPSYVIATAGRGLFVALLLFVGIPLPGTGAWTGTLAASFLKMNFKSSVLAAMCGVLLAGVIMMTLSAGFFSLIQ